MAAEPAIVGQLKAVLRDSFVLELPALMQIYIEDAAPDQKALDRWADYQGSANTLQIINGVTIAVGALVAAIVGVAATPAAGAVVAAAETLVEIPQTAAINDMKSKIDSTILPWQRPNNGINGAFVMARVKMIYSYRGFSSLFYQTSGGQPRANGTVLDSEKDTFDAYVDNLLNMANYYLKLNPPLRDYFPIQESSFGLDPIDREQEHTPLRSTNTIADRNREVPVLPQYSPQAFENLLTKAQGQLI